MSMDKSVYFECASGISGDMTVAALLDLGASADELNKVLATVPCTGFRTEISRVKKNGIDCCDFNVILDEDNHDHDMEYLFGHEHQHKDKHLHEHTEEHSHEHQQDDKHLHAHEHRDEHSHEHQHKDKHLQDGKHLHEHTEEHNHEHHHHHEHRSLSDVVSIIDNTQMSDNARSIAKKVFDIIARSEAKAHGTTIEEVHFHEVGAVDSIVDVISFAVCFDNLGIRNVYVKSVYEGTGTIRCAHGILPVPVPAVANIVEMAGLPLSIGSDRGEFVTPTGAAFLAATVTHFDLPKSFKITKYGAGAGKRNYERPSMLRAMLIEESVDTDSDTIVKLESNIDDCTGEQLAFTMEELMANGALDVHYIPCIMKKNRPAYVLNVICSEDNRKTLEKIIFTQTTTIGIRRQTMERTKLVRKIVSVSTKYGSADCKVVSIDGKERAYPEYKSVAELCRKSGEPFGVVYNEIVEKFRD